MYTQGCYHQNEQVHQFPGAKVQLFSQEFFKGVRETAFLKVDIFQVGGNSFLLSSFCFGIVLSDSSVLSVQEEIHVLLWLVSIVLLKRIVTIILLHTTICSLV